MSFTGRSLVAPFALLLCLPISTQNSTDPVAPDPATPASHQTLPQIVRLSLVQGDVRLAPGKRGEKLTGSAWEQAAADVPLATGFSLATGPDGRAEIEFEDSSTLYIAPNSALSFADLTTKDDVPHTAITLLSGTVTVHLTPTVPGEHYLLQTASHSLGVSYGESSYLRITSFLDGMQVTPLAGTKLAFNRAEQSFPAGATYNFYGYTVFPKPLVPTPETTAWDAWVSTRITARSAAIESVMQQAGLKTPVPGLADLAGQGTFTSCAPYGTCWEPTHGWTRQPTSEAAAQWAEPLAAAQSSSSGSAAQLPARQTAATRRSAGAAPVALGPDYDDDFPCDPQRMWYLRTHMLLDPAAYYPYDWAVCHAGFWIHGAHRYHWVAGTHKHHHCPVQWVKYHGKLAYVPRHPADRPGQPPTNLRHGLYTLTGRPEHPVERIALDGKAPPKLLETTPKDFRAPAPPMLARADSPQVAVHMMHEGPRPVNAGSLTPVRSTTLSFDQHSSRFVLATRVTDGVHTHTFTQPMSDHSGHIASSYTHSGGFSGGHSGGGFSGGHSGAGGGSHIGSGGGGGGSHSAGGGGGGTSSSASSGASSAGASAGGSHR